MKYGTKEVSSQRETCRYITKERDSGPAFFHAAGSHGMYIPMPFQQYAEGALMRPAYTRHHHGVNGRSLTRKLWLRIHARVDISTRLKLSSPIAKAWVDCSGKGCSLVSMSHPPPLDGRGSGLTAYHLVASANTERAWMARLLSEVLWTSRWAAAVQLNQYVWS